MGNIHKDTKEDTLKDYFVKFGEINAIYLIYEDNSNTSRGFGFIEYKDEDVASKVAQMKYHYVNEKNHRVNVKSQAPKKNVQVEPEVNFDEHRYFPEYPVDSAYSYYYPEEGYYQYYDYGYQYHYNDQDYYSQYYYEEQPYSATGYDYGYSDA